MTDTATIEPPAETKPRQGGRKPKVTTPRKAREKKRYEVQVQIPEINAGQEPSWQPLFTAEDTADGLKRIADVGEDGKTYRVVAIMAEKTVKVETRQVRTLE